MEIVKPHWSSSTFLVYAGGFNVLVAAIAALAFLASDYGSAGYTLWSLVIFAVLLCIAVVVQRRDRLVGGMFGFVAVLAFVLFVGALWRWFGWLSVDAKRYSLFGGFYGGALSIELIAVLASVAALIVFRFPLIAALVVVSSWLFVTDVLSDGGDWSTIVTIGFGLVLLWLGRRIDAGDRRPYGFWAHLGAGMFIGAGLLHFFHSGDWHWTLVVVFGVAYVAVAALTGRSSWAVLGYLGLASAAGHFATEWWVSGLPFVPQGHGAHHPWAPAVVFAILGFGLVVCAAAVSRRERRSPRPSAG